MAQLFYGVSVIGVTGFSCLSAAFPQYWAFVFVVSVQIESRKEESGRGGHFYRNLIRQT